MAEPREHWKSRAGFLMAAIGSAIGLGNIWRFSYMCYENGGGAFLIPYFVALATAGIPLLILEYGIGHKMEGSAPVSLRKVGRRWELLGWWPVVFVMFGIELYYCVIISWCVNYFRYSFNLSWGSDTNAFFFEKFLDLSSSAWPPGSPQLAILGGLAVVWILNWFICHRGIQSGIERACSMFIPFLFVLVAVLVVRGLMLPGAELGIRWYLRPDFSVLLQPKVWMAAYSQIFFDLSLGFGIMIAYASYLPRDSDISTNATIAGITNCGFSFITGFAVFSTLGYMAHTTGKPFEEVVRSGIGLAFVAYPEAISKMPIMQNIIAISFFLLLILAGLSSSISILEAFASSVMDKYSFGRRKTITLLCIVGFLGSVIFTTRSGLIWLDIVDHFLSQYGLVVVVLLECIAIGWIYGSRSLRLHVNRTSKLRVGRGWEFCVKILTPLILSVILVSSIYSDVVSSYGGYDRSAVLLIGTGWLAMTVTVAFLFKRSGWKNPETLKIPADDTISE